MRICVQCSQSKTDFVLRLLSNLKTAAKNYSLFYVVYDIVSSLHVSLFFSNVVLHDYLVVV